MARLRRQARLIAALLGVAACAPAPRPYRFAQPLLGGADLPAAPLGAPARAALARGRADAPRAIRVVSAISPHERRAPLLPAGVTPGTTSLGRTTGAPAGPAAHLAAADPLPLEDTPAIRHPGLPAPHRLPPDAPLPAVTAPLELRALAGRRDPRPAAIALAALVAQLHRGAPPPLDGPALLAWADDHGRRRPPAAAPAPGDLLVFDRVVSDAPADLVAIALGRDARGVTELLYLGGGVYRRGFLDPTRPAQRRDRDGAVVNTFLRSGARWPPPGTHYLTGELLAAVIDLTR